MKFKRIFTLLILFITIPFVINSFSESMVAQSTSFLDYCNNYNDAFAIANPRAPQLQYALNTAKSICRVTNTSHGLYEYSTGFLIAPNLVLTCAHGIGLVNDLKKITVQFGKFYESNTGVRYCESSISNIELSQKVSEFLNNGGDVKRINPGVDWAVLTLSNNINSERVLKMDPNITGTFNLVRPYVINHGKGLPMQINYLQTATDANSIGTLPVYNYCYRLPNRSFIAEGGASGSPFIDNTVLLGMVIGSYDDGEVSGGKPLKYVMPIANLFDVNYGSQKLKDLFNVKNGIGVIKNTTFNIDFDYQQDGTIIQPSIFVASLNFQNGASLSISFSSNKTEVTSVNIDEIYDKWGDVPVSTQLGQNLSNFSYQINSEATIPLNNLLGTISTNGQGKYKFKVNTGAAVELFSVNATPLNSMPPSVYFSIDIIDKYGTIIKDLTGAQDYDLGCHYYYTGDIKDPILENKNYSYKSSKDFDLSLSQDPKELFLRVKQNCIEQKIYSNADNSYINSIAKGAISVSNVNWEPLSGYLKMTSVTQDQNQNYTVTLEKAFDSDNFMYFKMKSSVYCRDENGINFKTPTLDNKHDCCPTRESYIMEGTYEPNPICYQSGSFKFNEYFQQAHYIWAINAGCVRSTNTPYCYRYQIKSKTFKFDIFGKDNTLKVADQPQTFNLPYEAPTIVNINGGTNVAYANVSSTKQLILNTKGNVLTYQWYKTPQTLIGTTTENYCELKNISANDNNTSYYCKVSNCKGTVTSSSVALKISDYPYPPAEIWYGNKISITTGSDKYFPIIKSNNGIQNFYIDWDDKTTYSNGTLDFNKNCRTNNSCYWQSFEHRYSKGGKYVIKVYVVGNAIPVSQTLVSVKNDITPILNLLLSD